MIYFIFFLISLFSSIIGGICGVGGGIIIKPVLDATGTMSVSDISFLSGCTVLCMSIVSVLRNRAQKGLIEFKTGTPLAIGATIGGILGKELFDLARDLLGNNNHLGAVQTSLLIFITIGTLIYSIFTWKIHTKKFTSFFLCGFVDIILGMISSFLGIGGGPINLMILSYFFSMDNKKAAANSLYIIMLSQFASFCESLFSHTVPAVSPFILILMVAAGIIGAMIGSLIYKRISNSGIGYLYKGFILLVIGICLYNLTKFLIF